MTRPSPFAPQSFTVEGLAAVAEYVRFRPAALTAVRCERRLRAEVEALLKAHGVKLAVSERERPAAGPEAGEGRPPRGGLRFAPRGAPAGRLGRGDGDAPAGARADAAPVTAQVTLKALEPDAFESRLAGRGADLILALDHITDPRNLGAIVRSAAFFGVREVLAPERRQVLLTQSAVATAQGGFALADLVCVVNLGRTLAALKEKGYWIIGTAMDGEAYAGLAGEYDKVVLVLGAEDDGLSKGVREHCDRLAAIPGRPGGLESLNVSVAAGIVLSAFAGAPRK